MSAIDTNMPSSQLFQAGGLYNTVNNPYDGYVTANSTPGQTSAWQKRRFHTQNYPDGVDTTLMIRTDAEQHAWDAQQDWQLSEVFPWARVNQLVLTLQHFEADGGFFSVTPEQAVAHMLTQTESTQTVSLARYSLTARLEWGFLKTPKGKKRYNALLQQFTVAMIQTAHAEVYRALLQAHDPQQVWLKRHGEMNTADLVNYMKWDLFIFGALQKERDNPMEKIDAKVKAMMHRFKGKADTYILGEEMEIYAQTVPIRKTRFREGGQEAVDRINGKLRGAPKDKNTPTPLSHADPVSFVNDSQVFVARTFHVENQGDVDPFKRTRQFGEWNILQDNQRSGAYNNARRSILVYDQTKDLMTEIGLVDCIENANCWTDQGFVESLSELGLNEDPDAAYDPFAMETNSYDSIKFIGDLPREALDAAMYKKAAASMETAMFQGRMNVRDSALAGVDDALTEVRKRLRGVGDNAYNVTWEALSDEDSPIITAFENVASRLVNIAGDSVFLDPATSEQSPGELLYKTIVTAGSVPVYKANGESKTAQEAVELALEQLAVDEALKTKLKEIRANNDTFESKIDQMAEVIIANINKTKIAGGKTGFNAYLNETMRQYREVAGGEDARVFWGNPAGYASPQAARNLKENWFRADQARGNANGNGGGQMEEMVEGGDADLLARMPVQSNFPADLFSFPAVSRMITSSIERLGQTNQRERVLYGFDEADLAGLSAPIGGEIDVDRRKADSGFVPAGFRSLGFANLSEGELRLRLGQMAVHVEQIARSGMSTLSKILALVYIGLPFTKQQLLSLANNNMLVPVNFLIARPNAQVITQIIAKCQSGGESGFTYIGQPDVMVGNDAMTKTHGINFHFYMGAFCHQPKNVFIIPDVFVLGYEGGLGTGFHTRETYGSMQMASVDAPSIICIMVDYNTRIHNLPNPFDITGHWNAGFRFRGIVGQGAPHYCTAARIRAMYGVGQMRGVSDVPIRGQIHRNTYMYRGHQEEDDGSGRTIVRPNTGHWGPDVYEGCKKVREGESYALRDMNYRAGR